MRCPFQRVAVDGKPSELLRVEQSFNAPETAAPETAAPAAEWVTVTANGRLTVKLLLLRDTQNNNRFLRAKLLPKALFTHSAMSWIVTAKYQDALPLYRQAGILSRFDGSIARNTLTNTVVRAGQAAQPIVNLMRDQLMEAAIRHGDETALQVLKEDGRAAQTKSYWLFMCFGVLSESF